LIPFHILVPRRASRHHCTASAAPDTAALGAATGAAGVKDAATSSLVNIASQIKILPSIATIFTVHALASDGRYQSLHHIHPLWVFSPLIFANIPV